MPRNPATPGDLLNALRSIDPTAPRLTWYGTGGERVELSGRVLENWAAKTANYLVDELAAEPGTVVDIRLPVHWKALVWLLASWAVGATVQLGTTGNTAGGDGEVDAGVGVRADVAVTDDPVTVAGRLPAGTAAQPVVVAVALPALQPRWSGELPDGVLDYAGDVRAYADVFFADDEAPGDALALRTPSAATDYAGLFSRTSPVEEAGKRMLVTAGDGWDAVVRSTLDTWAAGGSVVLLGDGVPDTEHLRRTEKVTAGPHTG